MHMSESVGLRDKENYSLLLGLINMVSAIGIFQVRMLCMKSHFHNSVYCKLGSKVHNSQRIDGFGEPFGPGDIIGCFIYLDDNSVNNRMNFYKNGVDQGIAYSGSEIPTGIYFPSISLYMKVSATVIMKTIN
jgi:hypothetical protein